MKKNKKRIEGRYIILLIILALILFLAFFSYTLKNKKELNTFEKKIKDTFTYTEKILITPINYTKNLFSDFANLRKVRKENEILKNNLEKIEAINTENNELKRQLKALKDELKIEYTLTDYDYLNATVTGRNIGFWFNSITLDKGSYNGVKNDMIVINSKGLIGKIINTTNFTSTVKLITTSDTNSKISVIINGENKNLYGLIYGYNTKENAILIEGISNTDSVSIGDTIYTSGLGGIFPSGILIGTVKSISTDEYDLSKIIKVKPSADFNNLNYVTILKRKDSNYQWLPI